MNIIQVCNILSNGAKTYKETYDRLATDREEKIKEVKKTYIQNTPAYTKALVEIEESFYSGILDAQESFSSSGMKAIESLRDAEWKRVGKIRKDKLEELRAVSDIPMTSDELKIVMGMAKVEGDYWCEKLCSDIAAKNGFDIDVPPSYATKMNALDQLQAQMEQIIKYYPSKDPAMDVKVDYVCLSDSVMQRTVKMYCGKNWIETEEAKAEQIYLEILRETSELDRARLLRKALDNPNQGVRNLVLCHVATRGDLSDFTIKFSHHSGEVEEFKKGRAAEYLAARNAIKGLEKAEDETTARRIYRENEGNRYFGTLLEAARKNNEELAGLLPDERDMPREKWIKGLQDEYLMIATGGQVHPEDVDGGDN